MKGHVNKVLLIEQYVTTHGHQIDEDWQDLNNGGLLIQKIILRLFQMLHFLSIDVKRIVMYGHRECLWIATKMGKSLIEELAFVRMICVCVWIVFLNCQGSCCKLKVEFDPSVLCICFDHVELTTDAGMEKYVDFLRGC